MGTKRENKVHWWVVYNEIAQLLFRFFVEHRRDSGNKLYFECINNGAFYEQNEWIHKFDRRFKIRSLDPIHIFASISGNKLHEERRIERINILLSILESENRYYNIDFSGCPTPAVVKILSVRSNNDQGQIWELFAIVMDTSTIEPLDFIHFKEWSGIDFTSFTIFLFWIGSNHFLPLDRNVKNFLKKYRLETPRNYETYDKLLRIIQRFNEPFDEGYGEYGLFREIALYAYNELNNIKSSRQASSYFISFIENPNREDYEEEITRSTIFPEDDTLETSEEEVTRSAMFPDDDALETSEEAAQDESETEAPQVIEKVYIHSEKSEIIAELGFKLVAIVPQENCDYLKILKHEPFYFEKTFTITDDEEVVYDATKQMALYNLMLGKDLLKVNVTAIVGKNGSGKSSLVELFFRMINNITHQFENELNTEEIILESGVNAKLYYISDGKLYCIHVHNTKNTIQEYNYDETEYTFTKFGENRGLVYKDLEAFFYTVAINYSHYALNSLDMPWVEKLFHKNDAYQAPIVLNPMRTEGNIDINTEDKLVKSRLLVNLFSEVTDGDLGMRQLTEKQQAVEVHFTLNEDKSKVWRNATRKFYAITTTTLYRSRKKIMDAIYAKFEFPENYPSSKNLFFYTTEKYILKKLVRIAERYAPYASHLIKKEDQVIHSLNTKTIDAYINDLFDDNSHITYKLKQAIYYLKYEDVVPKKRSFILKLDELEDNIKSIQLSGEKEIGALPLIELLPPSIFDINIKLAENDNQDKLTDFKFLSSGEKQQIYAASSILYHLQNLDSVENEKLVNYINVNFLLDEIELYYHPEMQRTYLDYLLKMLGRIQVKNINSINICMVTHSPYILSDIPDNYLLRLEDGKTSQKQEDKTFGANIHDLLANNFFMTSTTGEFAQTKIREIVDFYYRVKKYVETPDKQKEELKEVIFQDQSQAQIDTKEMLELTYRGEKEKFKYVINNIGEIVIKSVLENHIKFIENKLGVEDKKQLIEKLNEEIRLRQKELDKLQSND